MRGLTVPDREGIERFEDNRFHAPANGAYVTVYYTFQGNASNQKTGVDSAIFQLGDSTGRSWAMDAAAATGGPAEVEVRVPPGF